MNKSSLTSKQRPRYIWDPSRITQFESLYSILLKFSQQNFANVADFWRSFGKRELSKKKNHSSTPLLNLNYEDRLEPLLLYDGLGMDENAYKFSHIFPYLPPLTIHHKLRRGKLSIPIFQNAIEDDLRYCPVCLANQFHTPLFQAKWVHTCPVHKVALQTKCPQCGEVKPYRLKNQVLRNGHKCECGEHFLMSSLNTNNHISSTVEMTKCIKLYLDWLNNVVTGHEMSYTQLGLTSSQYLLKNMHDGNHYITEYWSKIFPPDKRILHMLYPKDNIGEADSNQYEDTDVLLDNINRVSINSYPEYTYLVELESRRVALAVGLFDKFKTEKSVFIDTFLKPHDKCIRKIKHLISEKGIVNYSFICPYAFSYILWELYWDDEHANMISPNRSAIDVIRHPHYLVLNKYYNFLTYRLDVKSVEKSRKMVNWFILQIFGLYLLSSLDSALDFTLRTARSEPGHPISPDFITSDNNPYFYFERDEMKGEIKFIAWRKHIEQSLEKRMMDECNASHDENVEKYVSALLKIPVKQKVKGIYALTQWCHEVVENECKKK